MFPGLGRKTNYFYFIAFYSLDLVKLLKIVDSVIVFQYFIKLDKHGSPEYKIYKTIQATKQRLVIFIKVLNIFFFIIFIHQINILFDRQIFRANNTKIPKSYIIF